MGFCFFFQAEDGIRDIGVTGVQTCALPIYVYRLQPGLPGPPRPGERASGAPTDLAAQRPLHRRTVSAGARRDSGRRLLRMVASLDLPLYGKLEIGRASCRERV